MNYIAQYEEFLFVCLTNQIFYKQGLGTVRVAEILQKVFNTLVSRGNWINGTNWLVIV